MGQVWLTCTKMLSMNSLKYRNIHDLYNTDINLLRTRCSMPLQLAMSVLESFNCISINQNCCPLYYSRHNLTLNTMQTCTWFNYILGFDFSSLCLILIIIHYNTLSFTHISVRPQKKYIPTPFISNYVFCEIGTVRKKIRHKVDYQKRKYFFFVF